MGMRLDCNLGADTLYKQELDLLLLQEPICGVVYELLSCVPVREQVFTEGDISLVQDILLNNDHQARVLIARVIGIVSSMDEEGKRKALRVARTFFLYNGRTLADVIEEAGK